MSCSIFFPWITARSHANSFHRRPNAEGPRLCLHKGRYSPPPPLLGLSKHAFDWLRRAVGFRTSCQLQPTSLPRPLLPTRNRSLKKRPILTNKLYVCGCAYV